MAKRLGRAKRPSQSKRPDKSPPGLISVTHAVVDGKRIPLSGFLFTSEDVYHWRLNSKATDSLHGVDPITMRRHSVTGMK